MEAGLNEYLSTKHEEISERGLFGIGLSKTEPINARLPPLPYNKVFYNTTMKTVKPEFNIWGIKANSRV